MWDDRVIDIWDDRLVFVLSALFGISIWIVIAKWREAKRAKRPPVLPIILLITFVVSAGLILGGRYFYYQKFYHDINYQRYGMYYVDMDSRYPSVGTVLAFIIGSIVGSFSARYIWRGLFSSRFGAQNPLIGALVVILLVIIYSLPVYHLQISALLSHVGLSSLKTPIAEFTFTEGSQFKGAVVSAAKASVSEEHSSAIPRPSYPRPGLDGLKHAVSEDDEAETEAYLIKDDRYITSFNRLMKVQTDQSKINPIMPARAFLRPVKILTDCLLAYVDIIPDSQLLMVDIKPVIQFFFQMHADAVAAVTAHQISADNLAQDADELRDKVEKVRTDVKDAIGKRRATSPDFVHHFSRCFATGKIPSVSGQALEGFTYLQPYVTIALANLLVAHGSPDEAIDVMTQWLYLWRCARKEVSDKQQHRKGCGIIEPSS